MTLKWRKKPPIELLTGIIREGSLTTYTIEKHSWGIRLTFAGTVDAAEMANWCDDFAEAVKVMPSSFGVFVDMRELVPLEPDAQKLVTDSQRHARESGMKRSAVILMNPTLTYQFKRIALQSGIYDYERYLDASSISEWEELGMKWVTDGEDPDAARRQKIADRIEQEVI